MLTNQPEKRVYMDYRYFKKLLASSGRWQSAPMLINRLCLLFLVCLASACDLGQGDGGGIGGSGITPPLMDQSGFSVGPITGFGSIVLNAQRFDTDTAELLVNGELANQSALRIGMSVVAEVDFSSLTMSRLNYYSTVTAPVEVVDVTERTFKLLNQSVIVNSGTTFEGSSLEQLRVGMMLEVSGLRDQNGTIVATYVRPSLQSEYVQLQGVVLGTIDSEQRLNISGLTVDLGNVDISQAGQLDLSFGSHVLVEGLRIDYDAAQNLLIAENLKGSIEPAFSNGDSVKYEGIVSTFDSLSSFTLNWQASSASASTRIVNQDGSLAEASTIGVGSRIEVEGSIDQMGILQASVITLIAIDDSEIQGAIEQLDSDSNTITVLGIPISADNRTRYPNNGSFASLRIGDYVEIDAIAIGTQLLASRLEIEEFDTEAVLEAPIVSVDPQSGEMVVAGVRVVPGQDTEFEDRDDNEITREEFFAIVEVSDIVEVNWDEYQSTALSPDEISIE